MSRDVFEGMDLLATAILVTVLVFIVASFLGWCFWEGLFYLAAHIRWVS